MFVETYLIHPNDPMQARRVWVRLDVKRSSDLRHGWWRLELVSRRYSDVVLLIFGVDGEGELGENDGGKQRRAGETEERGEIEGVN